MNWSQILSSLNQIGVFNVFTPGTYSELIVFTISILIYVVFVWEFAQQVGERDLFELKLWKYDFSGVKWRKIKKGGSILLYLLKYGLIFPLYVTAWFIVFSVLFFIMGKTLSVSQVVLIAMALVSTIRITTYFNEGLAHDLAKLLPFTLLGIFLTQPNFFEIDLLINRIQALQSFLPDVLNLISFSVFLEWGLRGFYHVKVFFRPETIEETSNERKS